MTMLRHAAIPAVLLVAALVAGCAAAPPPVVTRPRPTGAALDDLRRVVVVPTGQSRFASPEGIPREPPRAVDEALKWLPFKDLLAPIARAVYSGVAWLVDGDRASRSPGADLVPGEVVAEAFARTLHVSGPFNAIVPLPREPVGPDRQLVDAIVRVSVPSWGLMRVGNGDPAPVASFADVRVQMVVRDTGVVVWEHEEDVTHPERLSRDGLRDRAVARQEMVEVLEQAGQRLANELVYARNGGR
jgi:hypothetical protein